MSIYQIECRKYLSKNKGFAIIYIQLFFFPESNFTIHFSLLCFSPLIFEQYRIKIRKKNISPMVLSHQPGRKKNRAVIIVVHGSFLYLLCLSIMSAPNVFFLSASLSMVQLC